MERDLIDAMSPRVVRRQHRLRTVGLESPLDDLLRSDSVSEAGERVVRPGDVIRGEVIVERPVGGEHVVVDEW